MLHPWSRNAARSGFTLVELLLTLAILVSISAVVVPTFGVLLADRRLVRAGDQLRVEMMQTRLLAMRSGRTQMLQLLIGQTEARVRPWQDLADMTEAVDQTGSSQALLTGGNATAAAIQPQADTKTARAIELPEGILVQAADVQSSQRSFLIESQTAGEAAGGWSKPILFFPDGTTSTAAVTFAQPEAGRVVVVLRGLTGEVTVSEVVADDGLQSMGTNQ